MEKYEENLQLSRKTNELNYKSIEKKKLSYEYTIKERLSQTYNYTN